MQACHSCAAGCPKMLYCPLSTRRSQRQNNVIPIVTLPTTMGWLRVMAFSDNLAGENPTNISIFQSS